MQKYHRVWAADLDDVVRRIQVVEDGGGVGDEVALVAGEHAIDGFAIVLVREAIEDVALGRDKHLRAEEHVQHVQRELWRLALEGAMSYLISEQSAPRAARPAPTEPQLGVVVARNAARH